MGGVAVRSRSHQEEKRAAESVEELIEKILNGEITKEQITLTDELYEVYARHKVRVNEALDTYGERRAYKAAAKLRAGHFSTAVVYFHGPGGSGETWAATEFAKRVIAEAAERGERWSIYRAATGNPLDDMRGEEVVLLDELGSGSMDANDWLLLLDPHNANPARARYRNKAEVDRD